MLFIEFEFDQNLGTSLAKGFFKKSKETRFFATASQGES
jgi:hypothetical protein